MGSGVTKWMIEGADIINYILYMRFEMSTRTIRLKRVIMLPLGYPTSPSMSHSVMIRSYESTPTDESRSWVWQWFAKGSRTFWCLDLSHKHARPIYSSGALTQDFWRDELGWGLMRARIIAIVADIDVSSTSSIRISIMQIVQESRNYGVFDLIVHLIWFKVGGTRKAFTR